MDTDTTSAATAQFAALAREFCDWCEGLSLGTDATLHAAVRVARET